MSQAVKNIAHLKKDKNERVCVIIPAAGNTMKSSGPQCLLKVGNKKIIEHQLDILNYTFPNFYTVLVTGFESTYVMDNTPKHMIKVENERYENTNILRSICIGLRACTCDRVLIMYGDVLCTKETLNYDFNKSAVFLDKTIEKDTVGACVTNHKIPQLMYSLNHKWGQILYLTGKEIELFRAISYKKANDKIFPFEAINQVIDMGGTIQGISNEGTRIRDVNCNKDLKNIAEIVHENRL